MKRKCNEHDHGAKYHKRVVARHQTTTRLYYGGQEIDLDVCIALHNDHTMGIYTLLGSAMCQCNLRNPRPENIVVCAGSTGVGSITLTVYEMRGRQYHVCLCGPVEIL